jgi:hypothetical protein
MPGHTVVGEHGEHGEFAADGGAAVASQSTRSGVGGSGNPMAAAS